GRLLLEAGADTERPLPPTLGMSGVTPLHVAVFHGHQAFAELLLASGASVDAAASTVLDRGYFTNPDRLRAAQEQRRSRSGPSGEEAPAAGPVSSAPAGEFDDENVPDTTALHIAVANGFGNLTELLLREGADPRRVNGFGQNSLHLAARADSFGIARDLLAAGASPDSLDHSGFSPLLIAARRGNEEVVGVLLAANARVDFDPAVHPHAHSALVEAARGGNSEIVRRLIDQGGDPLRTDPASRGVTALYWAAFSGDPDITTALLDAGADPEAVTGPRWGARRPLHVAASYQRAEIVAVLAEAGALIDALDGLGESALVIAATDSNIPRALPALLQAGADPKVRTAAGDDLLPAFLEQRRATGFSPLADVRRLLEAGADPNGRLAERRGDYTEGTTALHIAANNDDAELVSLLLEFGADPTIEANARLLPTQNSGGLAFHLAPQGGFAARVLFEPTLYARPDRGEWISASFPDALTFHHVFHLGPKDEETGSPLLPNEYTLLDLAVAVQGEEPQDASARGRPGVASARGRTQVATVHAGRDWIFTGRARILRLESADGGTPRDSTAPEDPDSPSGTPTSIEIDLAALIADGDPSRDVPLRWGDIVEFSFDDGNASGLTADQTAFIDACTRRTFHAVWTVPAGDEPGSEESIIRETLTLYPANWIKDDLTDRFRIDPTPGRDGETARLLPFA
ncbi:MAG TPA: ankyrin repeat domain-containing protein, partial [Longimicrobiaceae bacterium]|nr:ankyrin repeat domain-containing protein [Longimicrobiaceae bacterium]